MSSRESDLEVPWAGLLRPPPVLNVTVGGVRLAIYVYAFTELVLEAGMDVGG
jgi:hypothetical protein